MKVPYIRFEDKYLPVVPIKIKGKEWVQFEGFVDTGASFSIFHSEAAEILGLELEKGKKQFVKVGDGSFVEVFVFNLKVMFAGKEFTAKIGFSRDLGIGFNIIGRETIFDEFKICFDESERYLEFQMK